MKKTAIGYQEWQTTNLRVAHFRNGEPIMKADDPTKWLDAAKNKIPAYCIPKYEGKEFKKAGFLYNWYAINDPRGLAPQGWLIPDKKEIEYLFSRFQNTRIACIELKSKSGWKTIDLGYTGKKIDGNGTNKSGFNAKPIPFVDRHGKYTFCKGVLSFWLKETANHTIVSDNAFTLTFGDLWNQYECGDNVEINIGHMGTGLPVRCMKKNADIEHNTSKAVYELLKEMEESAIKDEILQIVKPLSFTLKDVEW